MFLIVDATNRINVIARAKNGPETAWAIRRIFENQLNAVLERWGFGEAILCFDCGQSFRKEIFPEYKANRPAKPPIIDQAIEEIWNRTPYKKWRVEGYEADDLIASIVCQVDAKHVMFSGDKDLHQCLIADQVCQLKTVNTWQGNVEKTKFFSSSDLYEKAGILPHQFVEWQCLVGDNSDNLPGVPGVGEKTATQLLKAAGSLQQLIAEPENATNRTKIVAALKKFAPMADRMKSLFTLVNDLCVDHLATVDLAAFQ